MSDSEEITLYLDAGHGEYWPQTGAEAVVAWDAAQHFMDEDHDFSEEEAEAALRAVLPGVEVRDPSWCLVMRVTGNMAAQNVAYGSLFAQVQETPSGDDDTFDYWPSGARLLLAWAAELDRIDPPVGWRGRRDTAERMLRGVVAAKGFGELLDSIGLEA